MYNFNFYTLYIKYFTNTNTSKHYLYNFKAEFVEKNIHTLLFYLKGFKLLRFYYL